MPQHIRPPEDHELDEETRAHLAAQMSRRKVESMAQRTLAWRPGIMRAVAALQREVMFEGSLDPEFKMLVAQLASQAAGCTHCQSHAAFYAASLGGTSDRAQQLWEFETSDLFTDAERAAFRLAVAAGGVPNTAGEAHFAELRKHFDEGEQVEIVAAMAVFGWNNRWNDTVATETEDLMANFALDLLADQGFEMSRHRPDLTSS